MASPTRRLVAVLLHLGRGLLCLITLVPSHRSSTPPFPEPNQSDALRRLLLSDSLPIQS